MTKAIEIEDGIEAPAARTAYVTKYPFRKMKVGQSFWIAEERKRVEPAASQCGRRYGMKFICRKMENGGEWGIRVWRVA